MGIPENLPTWAFVTLFVFLVIVREGVGVGISAYTKWRAARMEEVKHDDQRNLAGYLELIGELKSRVQTLELTLNSLGEKHEHTVKTLRDEHIACLKSQAESQAKIAVLEDEVKELRQWRHEVANQANAEVLKAEVQKRLG